mmetsp:Transcript_47348/g.109869  ORF Transcript_47348/g.109869 Transcript_47348/m.109869 type:complete len:224 (+) Transcript_47348:103-774(+)
MHYTLCVPRFASPRHNRRPSHRSDSRQRSRSSSRPSQEGRPVERLLALGGPAAVQQEASRGERAERSCDPRRRPRSLYARPDGLVAVDTECKRFVECCEAGAALVPSAPKAGAAKDDARRAVEGRCSAARARARQHVASRPQLPPVPGARVQHVGVGRHALRFGRATEDEHVAVAERRSGAHAEAIGRLSCRRLLAHRDAIANQRGAKSVNDDLVTDRACSMP